MSAFRTRGISFRTKLVLALIGVVAPVLIVALLVLRRETDTQIRAVLAQALTDSRAQLQRVEKLRQAQLLQLGTRFAASNRLSSALQQAIEGDIDWLAEQIDYELELAGVSGTLAVFIDLDGNALLATEGRRRLPNADSAVALDVIQRLVNGDSAAFGYHRLGDRLYSVHPVSLDLVSQPMGFLLLGFVVDQDVATDIGSAIGANVCFVAGTRCVAASNRASAEFITALESAAQARNQRRIDIAGQPYALISTALTGVDDAAVVMALPLARVLQPFSRIQNALALVGAIALLLAIALALLLGRGLARPVRALVGATERVAKGDYDTRVEVTSRDELGTLANAFNEMTAGLLLRDRYKGVLDKVVSRDVADELVKGEIKLGGENREVTVLFADMRGFTPLSQGMEPQRVIGIINDVMERLSAAVEQEGGVVDKYVGDELMALFGAPVSYPDDALRGARAAVRMQTDIAQYNETRLRNGELPVRIGIGLNTGNVVAGNMGSQKRLNYTVLGEPVNLAARLCSAAQPDQILTSEATAQRISGDLPVMALGDRVLKGFSAAIPVFEIVVPVPAPR